MTQQVRELLQKIDPEGKLYTACSLKLVDPEFRYFYVWTHDENNSIRIVVVTSSGEFMIREETEADNELFLMLIDNECEQTVGAFKALGYEDIAEDQPLHVCSIPDAKVFYYWSEDVPSPLGDGHFVTMQLNVERTCHPTTPEELELVAAHFKELRDKAVQFSAAFDGAENARLAHVSVEPYFSLTTNELGTIPELYIGFTPMGDPILVHEAQIDDIISIDTEDPLENNLLFAIHRLMD